MLYSTIECGGSRHDLVEASIRNFVIGDGEDIEAEHTAVHDASSLVPDLRDAVLGGK